MKKILSLVAAVTLAATAMLAEAATPKVAEDPSAMVISTSAPAPRAHVKATKTKTKRHAKAVKVSGKKKAKKGQKHVKAKKVSHHR